MKEIGICGLVVAGAVAVTLSGCFYTGKSCKEGCGAGAFCDVDLDRCVRYAPNVISITSPTDGSAVGANVQIEASLSLPAELQEQAPDQLTYSAARDGGVLETGALSKGTGSAYTGTWAPGAEGAYVVTVEYADAQVVSEPVSVEVDKSAPVFVLQVPNAPHPRSAGASDPVTGYDRAWKRDETVVVQVTSSASDVDAESVKWMVVGVNGAAAGRVDGPTAVTADAGCVDTYCGEFTLDFSTPELRAFRGTFGVVVTGTDEGGNGGTADAGVKVTRWRWARNTGVLIKASVAIGSTGTVYLGTADGGTGNPTGLYALSPAGTVRWASEGGEVIASPSVGALVDGQEQVYAGINNASGAELSAFKGTDGGTLISCAGIGYVVESSLAISTTKASASGVDQLLESAIGIMNIPAGTVGVPYAIRPGANTPAKECMSATGTGVGQTSFSGNVVAAGTDFYFGDNQGEVHAFRFNNVAGAWDTKRWSVTTGFVPQTLALSGSSSTKILGGGHKGGGGGPFLVPESGSPISTLDAPGDTSSPVIDAAGRGILGSNDGSLFSLSVAAGTPNPSTAIGGNVRAAPVMGQGGKLYLATVDGKLQVRNSSNLSLDWEESRFGMGTSDTLGVVESSPSLDCARNNSGVKAAGRPGLLYVAGSGTLYSIIVDSRGLDTSAAWPKYQHDPRNTGNVATSLAEFGCP